MIKEGMTARTRKKCPWNEHLPCCFLTGSCCDDAMAAAVKGIYREAVREEPAIPVIHYARC